MYIYTYVYVYIHTRIDPYMRMYVCINVYTDEYIVVHMPVTSKTSTGSPASPTAPAHAQEGLRAWRQQEGCLTTLLEWSWEPLRLRALLYRIEIPQMESRVNILVCVCAHMHICVYVCMYGAFACLCSCFSECAARHLWINANVWTMNASTSLLLQQFIKRSKERTFEKSTMIQ